MLLDERAMHTLLGRNAQTWGLRKKMYVYMDMCDHRKNCSLGLTYKKFGTLVLGGKTQPCLLMCEIAQTIWN